MSIIINIDYNQVVSQATQIRNAAKSINQQLKDMIYKRIEDLHTNKAWGGQKYNDLVKLYNSKIDELNNILPSLVYGFPNTLETIAREYSSADVGVDRATKKPGDDKATKIAKIPEDTNKQLIFNSDDVNREKNNIEAAFSKIYENLKYSNDTMSNLAWKCKKYDNIKSKFENLVTSIKNIIDPLKTNSLKIFDEALEQIEITENKNMSSADGSSGSVGTGEKSNQGTYTSIIQQMEALLNTLKYNSNIGSDGSTAGGSSNTGSAGSATTGGSSNTGSTGSATTGENSNSGSTDSATSNGNSTQEASNTTTTDNSSQLDAVEKTTNKIEEAKSDTILSTNDAADAIKNNETSSLPNDASNTTTTNTNSKKDEPAWKPINNDNSTQGTSNTTTDGNIEDWYNPDDMDDPW